MNFEFATAARIVFGPGSIAQLGDVVKGLGAVRPLVVTGSRGCLPPRFVAREHFSVVGEPTIPRIAEGAQAARDCSADLVIGYGGGSAIDAAKAIAALATNPGDPLDHVEVVGRGLPLRNPPLALITIPTTAGAGAEVTRNAVLGSPEHRVKASIRSPLLLARVALVDPELTRDLPPHLTASTGLDALTQLIEPFVSCRANPLTDALCREGLRRAATHLPRAFRDGHDAEARENMSLASLFGGLALANAGLGVVHGFAAPIGGMFEAPHGAVCAALLPHGIRANVQALRSRAPEHPALARYREVAAIVTGCPSASYEDLADSLGELAASFGIPGLSRYGLAQAHVADVVEKAAAASSMKANPVPLALEELTSVLVASL